MSARGWPGEFSFGSHLSNVNFTFTETEIPWRSGGGEDTLCEYKTELNSVA
jgi:hypothetical protein